MKPNDMMENNSQRSPAITRIGLVMPSVNAILEPYAYEVAPIGVSFHSTRMKLESVLTPEAIEKMDREHGWAAVSCLAGCNPAVLAYCCMASSIVGGVQYDRDLRKKISTTLRVPATTVADSVIQACSFLGVRRVGLASPYPGSIVAAETKYLTDSGIEVACHETLDIAESRDVSGQDPDNIADLIRKVVIPGIDAVLISSINLPSHRVVASLERELGLPVITGATAVIWNVLRLCGRPPVAPSTLASAMLWRHGQGAM